MIQKDILQKNSTPLLNMRLRMITTQMLVTCKNLEAWLTQMLIEREESFQ
jgi:hypothetical protein